MNGFLVFILAIINGILIDNVLLSRFYGVCPFLGVSKKTNSAFWMGVSVTLVILLSTVICWPIYTYILTPAGIAFLDTIVYILVIASLVQITGVIIKRFSLPLYNTLGIYLPLITTNCAVLGVVQGNTDSGYSFVDSLANALGTGLGFLLVIFLFAFIRIHLESMNIPKAFKGVPIALVTASLMALAFLGFSGVISL